MTTTGSATTISRPTSAARVALGLVIAIVVAVAIDAVVAVIAHAAGAATTFRPLQLPAYASLTVLGMLLGTAGWAIIRRTVRRAASLLRWLVPTVLVLSFIPDFLLLASKSQPGTSGIAVSGLIVMHVVVATILVLMLRTTLPVTNRN